MNLSFFNLYKRCLLSSLRVSYRHVHVKSLDTQPSVSRSDVVDMSFKEYTDHCTKSLTGQSSIVVAHGLLGSKTNWHSLSKAINKTTGRRVIAVDLRGHGDSPHHPKFNSEVLVDDMLHFLNSQGLSKVILLGHSLGGRTMSGAALLQPDIVEKVVVVDITPVFTPEFTPKTSPLHYPKALSGLRFDSNMSLPEARKLAGKQLENISQNVAFRQFLLTNLVKDPNGHLRWRCDMQTLSKLLLTDLTTYIPPPGIFKGPTLFVGGGLSPYIRVEDHEKVRKYFPAAQFVYIPDASHFVHAEKPNEFLKAVLPFLM